MYEFADMILRTCLNKSFWLLHVYVFLGKTVKVSANEVNPPKFEIEFSSDGSSHSYGFKSSYACPHFVIVNSELLSIAFSNKSCFVLDSVPLTIPFYVIHPHRVHNICPR